MFQFIVYLRAICAVVITNAHYENIYPVSIIANGGLLGDVLFFAISGYCLYNIKTDFVRWYGKRILRIYPGVWIITAIYLLLGFYHAESGAAVGRLMIYPTYYHFVASIMVLYIIYYVLIVISKKYENRTRLLEIYMLAVAVLYTVLYIFVYDRSYYHIDSVYEPMIRFLFLESMLLGAWFREKGKKFTEKGHWYDWGAAAVCFVVYFASKLIFSRFEAAAQYQIINQAVLFILLFLLFKAFAGMEQYYQMLPKIFQMLAKNISAITLEIYLVQYALIPRLNIGGFPLNFIIVTGGIWASAMALHYVSDTLKAVVVKAVGRKER